MTRILLVLLICALPVQAAITVNARGTGGNNTGATSVTVTPGSDSAAGSMGIVAIALDNAGSGGNTTICAASSTDSVNNIWTRRLDVLFDNGPAAGGVEICIYTAQLTTAFTTSNNVVISFSSVSVTAKAWTLWEAVPTSSAYMMQFLSAAGGTGATTGAPSVTTVSITSGNVVIGLAGLEAADSWTGDGDTTNGSWSTHQHNGFGTGGTGMSVTAQSKVVTATATQSYDPTCTSADTMIGYAVLTEIPSGGRHIFIQ